MKPQSMTRPDQRPFPAALLMSQLNSKVGSRAMQLANPIPAAALNPVQGSAAHSLRSPPTIVATPEAADAAKKLSAAATCMRRFTWDDEQQIYIYLGRR